MYDLCQGRHNHRIAIYWRRSRRSDKIRVVREDFAAGFEVENNVVLEFAGIRIPLFFFDKEVVRLGENSSDANFFILFLKADCPALDTGRRRYYTVG